MIGYGPMEKELYLINAIYRATEGEGVFVGTPQIFVRYQGCNIGCINCDSKDTWDFTSSFERTWEELLEEINQIHKDFPVMRMSITGGDPLHPKFVTGVRRLAHHFSEKGWFVNIEASGQRIVPEIFEQVQYISFDYKTPTTQVKGRPALISEMAKKYSGKFQVKAVVEGESDFQDVLTAREQVLQLLDSPTLNFPWVLTPVFSPGESFNPEQIMKIMDANDRAGAPFRVIGQQHKFIHGPDKRNV